VQMFQTLSDKTQRKLSDARAKEKAAKENFENLEKSLKADIKNKKAELADLKTSISKALEQVGKSKADILAAKELLKSSKADLGRVSADIVAKTNSYAERTKKRDDEVLAIKEALVILKTYVPAKKKKASSSMLYELPASLLQVGQVQRRDAVRMSKATSISGLSFLEIQATSTSRSFSDTLDPFKKVKSMIREMLRKLEGEQSEDQRKGAWCDSELSKSADSKEQSDRDVTKVTDRIKEMDANLMQLQKDINDTTRELAQVQNASVTAVKLRKTEATQAQASLLQYKAAQKVIKGAIAVLKRVYSEKAEAAAEKGEIGYSVNEMGGGVIGILEVALCDYEEMEKELTLTEQKAQMDYNNFMGDAKVRQSVFEKDLDYKKRSKVKLESAKSRAGNDLQGYKKELDAINTYFATLKATCTIKGDSYEERKARRTELLKSLKEALNYLTGGS